MGKTTDETRLPLLRSERVRNYLIGVGAASALILGLLAQFQGEPVAEKTWEVLRANQNKHAKELNRIRMRLVYFQAWQEASTAMDLQKRLEALQKKYDAVIAGKPQAKATTSKPMAVAVKPPDIECKPGWALGADKQCHKVRPTVAARIKTVAAQAELVKQRLLEERKHRAAAEHKKNVLMRSLTQQKSDDLPSLPAKLDDVTKK